MKEVGGATLFTQTAWKKVISWIMKKNLEWKKKKNILLLMITKSKWKFFVLLVSKINNERWKKSKNIGQFGGGEMHTDRRWVLLGSVFKAESHSVKDLEIPKMIKLNKSKWLNICHFQDNFFILQLERMYRVRDIQRQRRKVIIK